MPGGTDAGRNRSVTGVGVRRVDDEHLRRMVEDDPSLAGLRLYVAAENTAARAAYESAGMDGERLRAYEWLK